MNYFSLVRIDFKSLQLKMDCSMVVQIRLSHSFTAGSEAAVYPVKTQKGRFPNTFLVGHAQEYFRKFWKEVCSPCVGERMTVLIRSWDTTKNMWGLNKFGAIRLLVKKEYMTGCNKLAPIHLFFSFFFFNFWNIETCNPITYVVNKLPAIMFQMCDLGTNHFTFPVFLSFFILWWWEKTAVFL